MKITKDKVRGALWLGAIGDAWGAPVEYFTPEQIRDVHPAGLEGRYSEPLCHKFFKDGVLQPGMTTDDTQFTVATMLGIVAGRGFDMDIIAQSHIKALYDSTLGAGKSTIEALQRLAHGTHWSKSGETNEKNRGMGNGIPMKCMPCAAWLAAVNETGWCTFFNQHMVDFAAMTHYTDMAALSGIIHAQAMYYLFTITPDEYDQDTLMRIVCKDVFGKGQPLVGGQFHLNRLNRTVEDIETNMAVLWDHKKELPHWTAKDARLWFGDLKGTVYNTLPGSYVFFFQNPYSFDTGLTTIYAGGDTDTNAKIVMEMIGALHGFDYFYQKDECRWAFDGLITDRLMDLADAFCHEFNVK
jgi:ADP-ribosylglycohydrolase